MAVVTDLIAAVNQIAADRGIEAKEIFLAIKEAIKTSYQKNLSEEENLDVEIDEVQGKVFVYSLKKVVSSVRDSKNEISKADAIKTNPNVKIGDEIKVEITPSEEFGRIAVQTARQVIMQKIREAEKLSVIKQYENKIGKIETGIIQRMEGEDVSIEIGRANAIMPKDEKIPGEFYKSGTRMKFLLKSIVDTQRGKDIIVSRADPKFLEELFRLEIPEINSNSVVINGIAREAGSRSKVAVSTRLEGIDPIGACVGQKGIRINNITDELKNEKIDIILYNKDDKTYIINSLSPAQVEKIELIEDEKRAIVIVPDDQLSLAIGKDGQNVRLAAKLTGWKIDIFGVEESKKIKSKGNKKEKTSKIKKQEEKSAKKEIKKEAKKEKKADSKKIKKVKK